MVSVATHSAALSRFADRFLDPKARYLVLAGAGVSRDSGLPTAIDLMDVLLDQLCTGFPRLLVTECRSLPALPRAAGLALRFEFLMRVIRDFFDERLELVRLLDPTWAEPNELHYLLARLCARSDLVCTTNFDSLIERAALALRHPITPLLTDRHFQRWDGTSGRLFKLHGSVHRVNATRADTSLDSVQASLDQVGQQGLGFDRAPGKRRFLQSALDSHDLLVLGYSGSDDFDVCEMLASHRSRRRILWIDHDDTARWPTIERPPRTGRETGRCHELLRRCIENGARRPSDIVLLKAPTLQVVRTVAVRLGVAGPFAPPGTSPITDFRAEVKEWVRKNLPRRWQRYQLVSELLHECERYRAYRESCRQTWRTRDRDDPESIDAAAHSEAWGRISDENYRSASRLCESVLDSIAARSPQNRSMPTIARATLLYSAGESARMTGDHSRAGRRIMQARAAIRRIEKDAPRGKLGYLSKLEAAADTTEAEMAASRGFLKRSAYLYRRALRLQRRAGDIDGVVYSLMGISDARLLRGQVAHARVGYEQAQRLATILGNVWHLAYVDLGTVQIQLADSVEPARSATVVSLLDRARRAFVRGPAEDAGALALTYRLRGDWFRLLDGESDRTKAVRAYSVCLRVEGAWTETRVAAQIGLAELKRRQSDLSSARKLLRGAVNTAAELKLQIEEAGARLLLYLVDGDRRSLRRARDLYRRCDVAAGQALVRAAMRGEYATAAAGPPLAIPLAN